MALSPTSGVVTSSFISAFTASNRASTSRAVVSTASSCFEVRPGSLPLTPRSRTSPYPFWISRISHSAALIPRTPSMALGKIAAATRCACSSRSRSAGARVSAAARAAPVAEATASPSAFRWRAMRRDWSSSRICRSATSTAVMSGSDSENRSAAVASSKAPAVSRLFLE